MRAALRRRARDLRPDKFFVFLRNRAGQRADIEIVAADAADRRHFGRRSRKPALLEALQLVREYMPLPQLNAAGLQQADHGLPGNAVQKAVRQRRVNDVTLHEEDVRAGRLGDVAAIVQHHRIRAAFLFRLVLRDRADHVQAGSLRLARDGFRTRPLPLGDVELRPLVLGVAVVGAPIPCGDRNPNPVLPGGNAHVLSGSSPDHRPNVGFRQPVLGHDGGLRAFNLVRRVFNRHVQQPRGLEKAVGVLAILEYFSPVRALPFEYRGAVVHRVGQDVNVRLPPRHQRSVHPDESVAVVVRSCHAGCPSRSSRARRREWAPESAETRSAASGPGTHSQLKCQQG